MSTTEKMQNLIDHLVSNERIMGEVIALDDLIKHIHHISDKNIPGAIVECGTWRGGCLAFIAKSMEMLNDPRPVWAFDSFEGMPEPGG